MTLTNENTASQSEELSEIGKELKLCVSQQEMQIIVKSLLEVLMGKSSVIFHGNGYKAIIVEAELQLFFCLDCGRLRKRFDHFSMTVHLCTTLGHASPHNTHHHHPHSETGPANLYMRDSRTTEIWGVESASQK